MSEIERRKKISETLKERFRNHPHWSKGKHLTLEHRERLSEYWKSTDKPGRFKKGMIPWNKGKKHPKVAGSKNPRWNGGITPEYNRIRNSPEMREWRRQIFKRDNYTCQICGQYGGKLEADHIKPFSTHPQLRFKLSNGRTLCRKCHSETPTYKRQAIKYKQE